MRTTVQKTYKLYIGGQFPRTESGRYYPLLDKKKNVIADICLSSRKDFRNAVVAARGAFAGWSSRSGFNRSQILYRIAEMLEGRKAQFLEELLLQGISKANAEKEIALSIDRLVYYAGWCDKYQQTSSTVNPVASSHFNFSVPEPTGVVAIVAPQNSSLIGIVSLIAPVIAGGNVCVALASEKLPLCAVTFGEVLATSDVPGGVVNILTGKTSELISHMSSHMDVNAIVYAGTDAKEKTLIKENASLNVKRVFVYDKNWNDPSSQDPYFILDTQEIKTTWHPIESIGAGGAKY
ncbi:MAG TPA: aldehyde dehydrogenase family protein [Bacteroidia bacterium]|jgi:acyl-CoA reductase-like NAD-dependent aldehyde dehydrogenase|nr:aldehyde dehydrogenase family protein [Bacteroidia bacterium]